MITSMWKGPPDMTKPGKYEALFFPTKDGLLKIHAYGFNPCGSWGEVFATIGDQTICVKGFNRHKTIVRATEMIISATANRKNEF